MDIRNSEKDLYSILELCIRSNKLEPRSQTLFNTWIANYFEFILSSNDFSLLRKYPLLCPAIVSHLIDRNTDNVPLENFILTLLSSALTCPIVTPIVSQYMLQHEILLTNTPKKSTIISLLDAITELVKNESSVFRDLNLVSFLPLTSHKDLDIKLRAFKLFSILFQIDFESQSQNHLKKCLNIILYNTNEENTENAQNEMNPAHMTFLKHLIATYPHWVEIQGVILAKISSQPSFYSPQTNLIMVPTTQTAVQSIAFSIAQNTPVLIKGEIGVGKTMLVSHIANCMGRNSELVTVQLSDQTDSKSLIGNYTSTDMPGEFVWKPGALVHAMQTGKWLLLEDIDYAAKDVVSTLLPILENNLLPIPGMSEVVTGRVGFQIFATQRTNANGQPLFSSEASLLDKYWSVVQVSYPTVEELETIISQTFPNLARTASKIIQIFRSISLENTKSQFQIELLIRKLTLRDLMKWCRRIENFVNGLEAINLEGIFLEALDCFVVSFMSKNIQQSLANQLGNQLGLNQTKIDYYFTNYKPSISFSVANLCIGRAIVPLKQSTDITIPPIKMTPFAYTQQTCMLLERLALCVQYREPVLLVGETGTGKTSTIQHLATQTNNKLVVINMSRQSDAMDLLGGYKPVDMDYLLLPLKNVFLNCFQSTFSKSKNEIFIGHIERTFEQKKFDTLLSMMEHVCKSASAKENISLEKVDSWKAFSKQLSIAVEKLNKMKSSFAFQFVEGALVKAIRSGWWVLLDEINLACPEVLECLNGVLDQNTDSILLADTYSNTPITKNENFHIFACMNPALDIGKKKLPQGIANRFTEIFVHELTQRQDLIILVSDYLQAMTVTTDVVNSIVEFYTQVTALANDKLVDGSGYRPHFSLRTLCRALKYSNTNPCRNIKHSIYEGLCLSFLTQLNQESYALVEKLVQKVILKNYLSVLKQKIPKPRDEYIYTNILGYWIRKGNLEIQTPQNYVITPAIAKNLKDIARISSARQYPILLQGPTSSGKTSLIQWLATNTGNKVYRINNHEHTDLQEYIGSYIPDENGKLVFQEGLLPRAMRNGDWIILDELNLAPSDVLEALNRVLDDNRELFITETQTTIKAHPNFILFATQNPPGLYGGRKLLSKAFRNRFIELHFVEIPPVELVDILHQRCAIPKSYCKKMIEVMKELQLQRKLTGLFAGKYGYITLRDLFKWAERYRCTEAMPSQFRDWDQLLIEDGYLLLAGKLRNPEEIRIVAEVLEKHFHRIINEDTLFNIDLPNPINNLIEYFDAIQQGCVSGMEHIYPTKSFRRILIHISRAVHFDEPILLVGPTGSGKTTACQLISKLHQKKLLYINCHMHTETADFIGSLRPVRNTEALQAGRLFEWMDGPLVQAVLNGEYMLLDEISLADDAVLERLNSLLEPERSLVIAEKGGDSVELIASHGFMLFGTMNPGGDFGKKELSPALRNRFTEIWCPEIDTVEDTISMLVHNIKLEDVLAQEVCSKIVAFVQWFQSQPNSSNFPLSKRDLLCWVEFINISLTGEGSASPWVSFIEGAHLVLLDGLGVGLSSALDVSGEKLANEYLQDLVANETSYTLGMNENDSQQIWRCPFRIQFGPKSHSTDANYSMTTPTVSRNVYRILRALQLPKPILLEGIPGVGKSSIVMTLARCYGYELVRINLSEQTDISDLFGADLPSDSGNAGEFVWRDGPLLRALKEGVWVLLDELNLASQSVLEGLNSCFDHRQEIYISELDKTFEIKTQSTRIFATQNPMRQGGGRKGLPKSFLNRFTKVFMQSLQPTDILFICRQAFDEIDQETLRLMVAFNQSIDDSVNHKRAFGTLGSPFEFNLRDIFRWCQLMVGRTHGSFNQPGLFVRIIYSDRMRTVFDKEKVFEISKEIFHEFPEMTKVNTLVYDIISTRESIQIGQATLERNSDRFTEGNIGDLTILPYQLPYMESIMLCVRNSWLPILVGSVGSGKSSIVRLLAKLTGNTLHEFSVNSAMDSYDLVGGFHQVGLERKARICLDRLRNELASFIKANFHSNNPLLQDTYSLYHVISRYILQNEKNSKELIECILEKTKTLKRIPSEIVSAINELQSTTGPSNVSTGQFVWIDSPLVSAAKQGHWLLIDNVNLCSASVLDRLNALLEPNGTLVLHEKGIVDDVCEEIIPHENFRLFFCMDHKLGELSRAMRNRGIEICISDVSSYQDTISNTEMKYGLLDMKFDRMRASVNTLLGLYEPSEVMQTDNCIPSVQGNRWRCSSVITINPILSNVLSESEIFRCIHAGGHSENFQKNLSLIFIFLSTQSDITYREHFINQNTQIFTHSTTVIHFISKHKLHELATSQIRSKDLQNMPLDISYRETFCRRSNLNRIMNEVEKVSLRIHIFIIQLYIRNTQSSKKSLFQQSKLIFEKKHISENLEIKCISYLYPFVSKILDILVEDMFWSTHHRSNWDAINQSIIWLRQFIEYIHTANQRSKENLTIVWYLLTKNFLQLLNQKGVNWEQIPEIFSLIIPIEEDLNTSMLDSPLIRVSQVFSRPLPLGTPASVDCAVGLQSLLDVVIHIPVVAREIICELSHLRSMLISCTLDLSNAIEFGNIRDKISELNKKIRLPLENESTNIPLRNTNLVYFYDSILYLCSIYKSPKYESSIIESSINNLFEFSNSYKITDINILSLVSPTICLPDNKLGENIVYFQDLFTNSITPSIQLLLSNNTPEEEILSYLFNVIQSIGGNWKSVTEQESNELGIKLNNFEEESEELLQIINHFACVTFTKFISDSNNFENIFSIALVEVCKAFRTIFPSKPQIHLSCNSDKDEILAAASDILLHLTEKLTNEQTNREIYQPIINIFKDCILSFTNWTQTNDVTHLHRSMIYLGLTMVNILTPHTPLDPVVIKQRELDCLEGEFENLQSNLEAHKVYYNVCLGISDTGLSKQTPLPIERLERRILNLENEMKTLKKRLAVRPSNSQYPEIFYTCRKVIHTLCDVNKINELIEQLETQQNSPTKCFQTISTHMKSIASTINSLQRKYLSYRDVITPVTFSLSILLYGLFNITQIYKHSSFIPNYSLTNSLILFSQNHPYQTNISRISHVINSENFQKISAKKREKICRLILTWVLEIVEFRKYSFSVLEKIFYKILNVYVKEWEKFVEREKKKEIEKDSLYRYKEEQHCLQTSEEIIDKDFKEKFPDYYEDFTEMESTETISKPSKNGPNLDENLWNFTEETYTFITNIHSYLHSGNFLIETPKCNRETANSEHFLQQRILHQYDLVCCMQTNPNDELSNLHIAAAHTCLRSITEPFATETYDFYLDPNPCELQQVKPAITVFKTKIYNLLEEWPDHSVLNQLILVADRILVLSVTSPIMQILTGLQILITKAQDWEAYAAKHVSIQEELGLISQLVIRYRKMELEGWPRILQATKRKFRMKSTKYFMHIYQVISVYFCKEDIGNNEEIEKIANLLKQLIESSCLGNFELRLNLLRNFKSSFKFSNAVFHTLASLYSFYSQFISEVKNRFESQCTPIEKELKDFVSISKWNDVNYWRLKDSVEKSHRTIHKYVRKYQEVLNEPVQDLLIIRTFNLQKFPELSSVDWLREKKSKLIQTLRDSSAIDISFILEECRHTNISLPNRTDKISGKLSKYILRYSKDDKQLQGIAEFRNVTSEIREAMNEIISETKETLTPDQKEEMKRQKFLCVKKQKLLSELFKLLRTFGFSNRFTSTGGKTLLDKINFSSIRSLLPSQTSSSSVITSLQNIDAVFFENTKLIASLDISLRKPHKQLTPFLVESLRAYSIDTLHSIITHRQQILQFAQTMNELNDQIMHSSAHENTVQSLLLLPTQTRYYLDELCSVLHGLLEQLRECSCLVTAISRKKNEYFPLDNSFLPQIILLDYNLTENIKQLLNNTSNDVNTLLDDLSSLQNRVLFDLNDFALLKDKYSTLTILLQRLLSQLTDFLTSKATGRIEYGFFRGLFEINSNFEKTFQQFLLFQPQIETISSDAVYDNNSNKPLFTSNIFQIILTTVQELTKINKSKQTTLEELKLTDTSRNTDCYLKNLLTNNEESQLCQHSKIILLLKKTISNLKSNLDQQFGYNQESIISFLQLQSVLKSFVALCESIFMKHVEIQINSNELLQTILSIFNLVSAKGFCTPEAVIEELAKEGDSILQEFEGGGFGEGEGATNVSEQIDNQEQIEDLKGEEPKEENKEEVKEEKGIEMSEDFEGGMGDKASGNDDEGGSEGSREDDLDKRMGEVDEKEGQMDEELWGASSEDEEGLGGKEDGGTQSKEERLMAKDDSVKNRKSQNEDGKEDGDADQLQEDLYDNLDLEDQRVGENVDNEQEGQQPEAFDIPEDLNLDGMDGEDSNEPSLQGSDHDSVDGMDLDDTTQDSTQTQSDEDESNFQTMDQFGGKDSNSENELDANQKDFPSHDTTEHAGDPQTAQQSSSKYGTGDEGEIDENTQNKDDLDKVGCHNDRDVTETQDGKTGSENKIESTNKRDNNNLKSKLSRSAENRQLADKGDQPKLKKQKVLNEDSQENINQSKSRDDTQISDTFKHKTADSEKFQTDNIIQDSATHEQAKLQPQQSREDFDLDSNDETTEDLESNKIKLDQDAELHMDTHVTSENTFVTQDPDKETEGENTSSDKMEDSNTNKDLVSFFASNKDYIHSTFHTSQTDIYTVDIDNIQQLSIADETQKLWLETEHETSHLSRELCEQLRLILQPQQASKLKGDYRTGKRLNMRKIIPYIASEFRNDKIWLCRTQPNKRQYQVMLAIDDSKSMANYKSQTIAFQTFSLLGNALTWLDVGQLGVCKFGETTEVILPLGTPFTQESAFQILQQLTMKQMKTKIAQMLRKIIPLMVQNYSRVQTPFSGSINQLLVIISDGRGIFLEGRDVVEKSVRQTMEKGIFVIFIILDSPENRDSIVDIKVPIFSEASPLPDFKSYLEIFPFPFYIVLRDIQTLPETVSNALRQWFEFVASNEQC